MDLEQLLDRYAMHEGAEYQAWIEKAAQNPEDLALVFEKAYGGSERERKRANWILHHVSDKNPEAILPYVHRIVKQFGIAETEAEIRFGMRYFSEHNIPDEEAIHSFLLDYCLELLPHEGKSAAPRIYAITILKKLVIRYPELAHEIEEAITLSLENATAGMRVRARKALDELRKLNLI